jgi:hypothetical protein
MQGKSRKVAGPLTRGMLAAAFSAALLFLALLLAASAAAQEVTEQTNEVTTAVAKAGDTIARAGNTATGAIAKTNNAVAKAQSIQSINVVQRQTSDQAQATEDDSQTATRAAGSLQGANARITENTGNTIVDRVIIPSVGCDVGSGATVTIREGSAEATFTRGDGVVMTVTGNRITIEIDDSSGNVEVDTQGGQFGATDETVTGRVVSSTGIKCARDDEDDDSGDSNGDDGANVADGCTGLRIFEGDEAESATLDVPEDATDRLRIVFSTLNEDGELEIAVGEVEDRASGISETIEGADTGVILERIDTEDQLAVSLDPTDQNFRAVVEGVGGDDDCTRPRDVRGVLADSVPGGVLPETGGLPTTLLAAGLLLTCVALIGVSARRGR